MIYNILINAAQVAKVNLNENFIRSYSSSSMHTPNSFDKRLLVYFKKYKSADEIPSQVSYDTLQRIRGKARMYIATGLMIVTLIGCYVMVKSGKQAAVRGEYVTRQNMEWHRRINENSDSKK